MLEEDLVETLTWTLAVSPRRAAAQSAGPAAARRLYKHESEDVCE